MYVTCASIKLSSFYQLMSTSVGVHLYLSPSGRPAFPPEPEPAPRSPGRGSTNKTAPLKCFAELHTGKKKNVNTGVLEYVHNKCSFNLIVPDVRVFFNLLNFRYYCDSAYVCFQSHQLLIFHRLETSINILSGHEEQVRIQYATKPKQNNLDERKPGSIGITVRQKNSKSLTTYLFF